MKIIVLALAANTGESLMHRASLLIVTALGEVGTGLLALVSPSVLLALLLGVDQASVETIFVARIAGAALLALGVACWLGRFDEHSAAQHGLLTCVLIYDVAAAAILAYTGLFVSLVGIALWPAVVLHAALAVWCIVCHRGKPCDAPVGHDEQPHTALPVHPRPQHGERQ